MKKSFMFLLLMVCCIMMQAQETQTADLEYFREQVKILGSDEFGGRKPLTEYETKTINHIADQYKAIGLQPAYGDSYLQPVREITTLTRPKDNKLTVKGKKSLNLIYGEDVVVWTHRNTNAVDIKNAEILFCGFGIDAPEYNWQDFDGIDVKGKIILAMVNDPGYYSDNLFRGRNMTYYGRWCYKLEEAQRRGALGCLVIHNTAAASYDFQVCRSSHMQNNLALLDETDNKDALGMCGWIHEDAVRAMFKACGKDYDVEAEKAKQPGFKSYSLGAKMNGKLNVEAEIATSHNVVGILPGTDLKDQAVVISAHWDHFGIGEPINGDSIYNGAADNASGVAAMLMQAKRFSKSAVRPRRSIIFVATTTEEGGLLGSEWYCEHPLIPLSKTAAVINFDGSAPGERTHDLNMRAAGKSDLDEVVEIAAAAQGRYIKKQTTDAGGGYFRADHFNFCKKGVPTVLVGSGNDFVDKADHEARAKAKVYTYHQPNDEYNDNWDFSGAMLNQNLYTAIITMIANKTEMPKWAPDADFQRMED